MQFDLYPRTVFLTLSGSHAYGMATETSDYDYRGIVIAPMSCYIGLIDKFEQIVDGETKSVYTHYPVGFLQSDPRVPGNSSSDAPDMQVMELVKFIRLAINNNPSVLETLFTEESNWLLSLPIMKPLLDNKEKLLSKMVKSSFCGYAVSQLNRAKRHRRWLLSPPSHKPTREEFGLPQHMLLSKDQLGAANALIQRELDEFMVDQTHLPEDVKIELPIFLGKSMRAIWNAINTEFPYPVGEGAKFESIEDGMYWGAAKDQDFSENFLEVLVREKRYRTALQEWSQYQTWLLQRNPARADMEAKVGYDSKNVSHLVRLLLTCRQILETGKLVVKRPEAELLLEIRRGAWTYDQVIEFSEKEDVALGELVKTCSLPKVPDIHFFDKIVRDMILEFNQSTEQEKKT